jgi:hypothetical protein
VLSQATAVYDKSWGLGGAAPGATYQLIFVDYTGLAPAP